VNSASKPHARPPTTKHKTKNKTKKQIILVKQAQKTNETKRNKTPNKQLTAYI